MPYASRLCALYLQPEGRSFTARGIKTVQHHAHGPNFFVILYDIFELAQCSAEHYNTQPITLHLKTITKRLPCFYQGLI